VTVIVTVTVKEYCVASDVCGVTVARKRTVEHVNIVTVYCAASDVCGVTVVRKRTVEHVNIVTVSCVNV
jgi:hypothetical protein